jgi:S-formylglutathione hydrolase FrmB
MPAAMHVLLPQRLASEKSRGTDAPGPYKALYLLHGKRQDHTSWLRRTTLEDKVANLPLAVIMPQAHLSWYADMKYGRRYFSFLTRELPQLCENMFNLSPRREDRFIAGLSMGGYGAIKAALAMPETFGGAMSMSGVLDIDKVYDRKDFGNIEQAIGTREEMRGSVCDLFASAGRYPKDADTRFYLCCGTEDSHIESARSFRDHARALGLKVSYDEAPGEHNWAYWESCIPAMLRHCMGED